MLCLIFFLSFCFFVCCDLSVRCCCCCFICPKSALRCKQLKNIVLCLISFLVFFFVCSDLSVIVVLSFASNPLYKRIRYKQLITASRSHSLKEFVRQ